MEHFLTAINLNARLGKFITAKSPLGKLHLKLHSHPQSTHCTITISFTVQTQMKEKIVL
jgi:hypothetical protein